MVKSQACHLLVVWSEKMSNSQAFSLLFQRVKVASTWIEKGSWAQFLLQWTLIIILITRKALIIMLITKCIKGLGEVWLSGNLPTFFTCLEQYWGNLDKLQQDIEKERPWTALGGLSLTEPLTTPALLFSCFLLGFIKHSNINSCLNVASLTSPLNPNTFKQILTMHQPLYSHYQRQKQWRIELTEPNPPNCMKSGLTGKHCCELHC